MRGMRKMMYGSLKNTIPPVGGTLLPGMSFMRLPTDQWTETFPNVWKQKQPGLDTDKNLGYLMQGDGSMFFKYKADGFNRTPDMMLFNTPTLTGGTTVIDLWVDNGAFKWDDPNGGERSESAVDGVFYGLVRSGNTVKIMKSIDGVNLTQISELAGDKSGYIYLQTWWHPFETDNLYYPQGVGLTLI